MKAAVLRAPNQPLSIEELQLADPGPGEVRVRLVATGVCHTDASAISGAIPVPTPIVLGHEGAGIVEAVGPAVTMLKPGDHVVLSVMPSCGKCPACVSGQPWLCHVAGPMLFAGQMLDGTRRLSQEGQPVNHFFAQSSFAEHAVVAELGAAKVRDDAPLDIVAPLACGASTGIGAILNAARVEPGASVAVIGCGGVGLSGIMAAHLAEAGQIIAVDIAANKLAMAQDFGATHLVDASASDPVAQIRNLTHGFGVDYSFEFIGRQDTMEQAIEAIHPGGHAYIIGGAPVGTRFSADAMTFLFGKNVHGVVGGFTRPTVDIPRFVELYMSGRLPLDRLVSRRYPLEEINEAFEAMHHGEVARSVITF